MLNSRGKSLLLHLLLFQPALNKGKPHIKAQLTLVFYKVKKKNDKQVGPPKTKTDRPKLKWTGQSLRTRTSNIKCHCFLKCLVCN